jgi:hypothetical protein
MFTLLDEQSQAKAHASPGWRRTPVGHPEYYGRLDGLSIERIVAGIWELSRRKVPVPMARNYWQGEIRDCTILRRWLQERLSGIAPRTEEDFWQLRKCEANDWVDEPQLKLAS